MAIRQIGDSVLHQATLSVDFSNQQQLAQLKEDFTVMENNLHEFGGAGIASNQCGEIENPLNMIIIGMNDPEGRNLVQQRYPDQEIPFETIMINPTILSLSEETYYPTFGEGCLSVYGSLRAKVKRHRAVTVKYSDLNGEAHQREFIGFSAHIVQHECDHLQGIVYIERIFSELSKKQKDDIRLMIEKQITQQQDIENINIVPNLIFDRKQDQLIYDTNQLEKSLSELKIKTLNGLLTRLINSKS